MALLEISGCREERGKVDFCFNTGVNLEKRSSSRGVVFSFPFLRARPLSVRSSFTEVYSNESRKKKCNLFTAFQMVDLARDNPSSSVMRVLVQPALTN